MGKRIAVFIASSGISFIVCVLFAEMLLRIWRPPYVRMQGKRILLDRNVEIENLYDFKSGKIRNRVIVRKNSLGFRGPEPPVNFSSHKTFLTVGGSTTECIFITQGKTWSDVLDSILKKYNPDTWVNNAGIDGSSTFGHIKLLEQYILDLKPDYVLFLVGVNDMAIDQETRYDTGQYSKPDVVPTTYIWQAIKNHSMVLSYIDSMRSRKGQHMITANADIILDLRVLGDSTEYQEITASDIERYTRSLAGYKQRLRTLIELTKENLTQPVFVTQPALYGIGIDPETGTDLEKMIVSDFTEAETPRTGKDKWLLLEMYNDATREISKEMNVPYIDLAKEMPKNSRYFYDFIHYTEEGSDIVGNIIANHMIDILGLQ